MRIGNIKKYTIALFVCFFAFMVSALAEDETANMDIGYGEAASVPESKYSNLVCQSESDSLSVNGSTFTYNKLGKDNDTVIGTCTFDSKKGVESKGSGTITITFTLKNKSLSGITIDLGALSSGMVESADVISALKTQLERILGTTVSNINVTSTEFVRGEDNIDVSCGGTSCTVSLSDEAKELGIDSTSTFDVTYTIDGSSETLKTSVRVNIKLSNVGYKIYPGAQGTCNLSGWQEGGFNDSTTTYRYYKSKEKIPLPTCEANKSYLTFKGWRTPSTSEHIGAIGDCSNAIPGGSMPNAAGNYASCYEMSPRVQISFGRGSLENSGEWEQISKGAGYFYAGENTTVTLPNLTFSGFSKNTEFKGWRNKKTGNVVDPGTSVPVDGSIYVAEYETTTIIRDLYKTVKVNDTVPLVVEGISACSVSGSSKITTVFEDGICKVTGVEATADDEYVDVVTTVNGETITYKFSVTSLVGSSQGGDGDFIIDTSTNIIPGINDNSTLNNFKTTSCNDFNIKLFTNSAGQQWSNSFAAPEGTRLNSSIYNAVPKCSNDTNNYKAFCLDPGRAGPNGSSMSYSKTADVSAKEDFKKFITYIANNYDESIYDDLNNKQRIAIHVVARILAIVNKYDGTVDKSDLVYASHYRPYKNTADAISRGESVESAIANMHFTDSAIESEVKKILTEYKDQDVGTSSFERTIDERTTEPVGTNGYINRFKGTISLPAGATSEPGMLTTPSSEFQSHYGVTLCVKNWSKNEELSGDDREVWDYEVEISADDASKVLVPVGEDEQKKVSFRVGYNGGATAENIFIASPIDNVAYQRMLIFNMSNTEVYIYFSLAPATCDIPALDYKTCTDEENCSSSFNKELFKASGCCKEVTDEVTYSYVINNVCNGKCTTSTLSSVCDFKPENAGSAELYEIKEGAKYNGEDGTYTNAIGTCVVNVGDYASANSGQKEYFKLTDDAKNSINVEAYNTNRYCQVTCKEDWTITMEAFGNYVGARAVAAGTYFAVNSTDIFIGGKRECYTSYINYDRFMSELVEQSQTIVSNYNNYSNDSHAWSDIDEQASNPNVTFEEVPYCAEYKKYEAYALENGYGGSCPYGYSKDSYDYTLDKWKCSMIKCDVQKTAYKATLKLNHEFKGEGDTTKGTYQKYTGKVDSQASYITDTNYDLIDNEKATHNLTNKSVNNSYILANNEATAYTADDEVASCEIASYGGYTDGSYDTLSSDCLETPDKDAAYNLLAQRFKDRLNDSLTGYRGNINTAHNTVYAYSYDLFDCQHFELYNSSSVGANNDEQRAGILGAERPYVRIETLFDPSVSYTYDESPYMTILGKDNILEMYTEKNDKVYGGEGAYADATNKSIETEIKTINSDGEAVDKSQVSLDRNYLSTSYYDVNAQWLPNSDEAKNYHDEGAEKKALVEGESIENTNPDGNYSEAPTESKSIVLCTVSKEDGGVAYGTGKEGAVLAFQTSSSTPEWIGGRCKVYDVTYYKANYIKSSISNSSFYKNKGNWYLRTGDIKAHGDTLVEALTNENSRLGRATYNVNDRDELDRWSPYNLVNVFPVSLNTPRNLYTYTYRFGDIGSYDNGELGRIMGKEDSLILQNERSCFYEVYEEVCLCCGSSIVSYTDNAEGEINNYLSSNAESNGYNYLDSSDLDKLVNNKNGTLAIMSSTVALGDMDSDQNRTLASNWGENSPFYYQGENYAVDKGAQLKEVIENKGETVYSDDDVALEYSFHLTPDTLVAIRDYNDANGYEVYSNKLIAYGRSAIAPIEDCSSASSCKWTASDEEMDNKYVNFQHYGSKFLEEFLPNEAVNKSLSDLRSDNNVCFVTSASDVAGEMESGNCRWVDYIATAGESNIIDQTKIDKEGFYTGNLNIPPYLRTAFK